MAPYSNDASYCPLISCKKLASFNDWFSRKCPTTYTYTFLHSCYVTFFYFTDYQLHAKFKKKVMSGLWDICRWTNGQNHRQGRYKMIQISFTLNYTNYQSTGHHDNLSLLKYKALLEIPKSTTLTTWLFTGASFEQG